MAAKRKTSKRATPKAKARGVARAPVTATAVTAKAFTAALARIVALEAQVAKLRAAVQLAGNDVTIAAAGTLVLRASVLKLEGAGTVQMTASRVDVSAGLAQFDTGILKVSGIVQCDTMQATSVIASSYTPGAGNIW